MVAAVGIGAVQYTSINPLGWALARGERYAYVAPMVAGVAIGLVSAGYLVGR